MEEEEEENTASTRLGSSIAMPFSTLSHLSQYPLPPKTRCGIWVQLVGWHASEPSSLCNRKSRELVSRFVTHIHSTRFFSISLLLSLRWQPDQRECHEIDWPRCGRNRLHSGAPRSAGRKTWTMRHPMRAASQHLGTTGALVSRKRRFGTGATEEAWYANVE